MILKGRRSETAYSDKWPKREGFMYANHGAETDRQKDGRWMRSW